MQGAAFSIAGTPAWVSRSGYTGEDGFEISVAAAAVEPVADSLVAHQAVKPIGLGARDSLRLEAGLPLYGHDLDTYTTPVMAGLQFAIQKRRRAEGGFAGPCASLPSWKTACPEARRFRYRRPPAGPRGRTGS